MTFNIYNKLGEIGENMEKRYFVFNYLEEKHSWIYTDQCETIGFKEKWYLQ